MINKKYKKIADKVIIYKKLLKSLLKKCKIAKSKLDMFHSTLYTVNSTIQLTVIWFSATSTFLQALISDDKYSSLDTINNSSGLINIEDIIAEDEYITFLDTTTLAITSYSSLIISFARHFKIEERLGNVSNLVERFAEIISRIQYDLETLKPWENIDRVISSLDEGSSEEGQDDTGGDDKDNKGEGGDNIPDDISNLLSNEKRKIKKNNEWITTEANIKKEYLHILDIKKELFISYEKIIGMSIYRKYRKLFDSFRTEYKADDSDEEDETKKHDGKEEKKQSKSCWCRKPSCSCCACGCNMNDNGEVVEDKNKGKLMDLLYNGTKGGKNGIDPEEGKIKMQIKG